VSIRAAAAKPPAAQVAFDRRAVVIAVRRSRHEARRVGRKDRGERVRHDVGELVVLDPVPRVEEERTARAKDAARFGVGVALVGEEHDAELADDGVELAVGEGQLHRVGLLPLHRPRGADLPRGRDHAGVEVGGDDLGRRRQLRREGARDDTGAGGDLENPRRRSSGDAAGHVLAYGAKMSGTK
jgi:hypothetical protein